MNSNRNTSDGNNDYDLVVIGSGSASFAAAIAASRSGLSVVMIEKSKVGGTCVNFGCIPSKALLAAAKQRWLALESKFPGIATRASDPDISALVNGKEEIVDSLQFEKYTSLATTYGFEILYGTAEFAPGPTVTVGDKTITASHYLVATGASTFIPPIPGLEEAGYLTSATAIEIEQLPNSLVVIGGNAIGLEMAQLFSDLGSKVTVIEALERIAPFEEPEISKELQDIFEQRGVSVITSATISSIKRQPVLKSLTLKQSDGQTLTITTEEILVATGRRPNTSGLGLESVGVAIGAKGEVTVDEHLRSANPRIWAAGDVTGMAQFVYVAGLQGKTVVENAFFNSERTINYSAMPRVTFTSPAIASVGLTDQQAQEAGFDCDCRVLPLSQVPRPIVERDIRGLVKIVADAKTSKILGIHILAEGAGEVILAGVYALEAEFTVQKLADTWCPYLTMGEAVKLAAQSFTRDISELSCCAS